MYLGRALLKLAEDGHKGRPGFRVPPNVAFAAAQSLGDIPEALIESSVDSAVRHQKLPGAHDFRIAGGRALSRFPVAVMTAPVFVSGVRDITKAKDKTQERRGIAKVLLAGGMYSGMRGGLETAMRPDLREKGLKSAIGRMAGYKTVTGIGSAALTAHALGSALKQKKEDRSLVAPTLVGASLAAGKGVMDETVLHGLDVVKTPEGRRGLLAAASGKAAAGAASTLFLGKILERALQRPSREKKAEEAPSPELSTAQPISLYDQTARWAARLPTEKLQEEYAQAWKTTGEETPSGRAFLYAVYDELRGRGIKLAEPPMRSRTIASPQIPLIPLGLIGLSIAAPNMLHAAVSSLPPEDRKALLLDGLVRQETQKKILMIPDVEYFNGAPFSNGGALDFSRAPEGTALGIDHARREVLVGRVAPGSDGLPGANKIVDGLFGTRLIPLKHPSGAPYDAVIFHHPDFGSPATIAHEMGHLEKEFLSSVPITYLRAPFEVAKKGGKAASAAALIASAIPGATTQEDRDRISRALMAVGVIGTGMQLPLLAEEASASMKGLELLGKAGAHSGERARAAAALLAAWGTYAASLPIPFLAAAAIRHAHIAPTRKPQLKKERS